MDTKALSIPGLQGENVNVSASERMLSVFAGGALTAAALRQNKWAGAAFATAGGLLLWRGITGHCPAWQAAGINSATKSNRAHRAARSVVINAPAEQLYAFWRNFENLPQVMEEIESVRVLDSGRSVWTAKGPLGKQLEWESEVVSEVPNRRIEWRSIGSTSFPNSGSVEFSPRTGNRGTMVRIEIEFQPPAGSVGLALAKVTGRSPDQQLREDLRRFRQLMETGDIVTTTGQPSARTGSSIMAALRSGTKAEPPASPEAHTVSG